jgi:hypothetical protein
MGAITLDGPIQPEHNLKSGLLTGGEITINVDPTKFDVAAGTGVIVDWSDPANPTRTLVSWDAKIGESIPIMAAIFTTVHVEVGGTLHKESGALPARSDFRVHIGLQSLIHSDGLQIDSVAGSSVPAYQVPDAILDYIDVLGPINSLNDYFANGVNLTVDKTVGTTTLPFINRNNDTENPTIKTNDAQSPVPDFTYYYQDGIGGFTPAPGQTDIDPNQYDDGDGGLGAVPNNDWTIQRLYFFGQAVNTTISYGQVVYNSMLAAEAAIFTESPILDPIFAQGTFTTALIVQEGATDLSDPSQAKFVDIAFAIAAGAGGANTTLQQAYELSLDGAVPEIVTDATRKAVTFKDGTAGVEAIFETLNAADEVMFSSKNGLNAIGAPAIPNVAGGFGVGFDLGSEAFKFKRSHARQAIFGHIEAPGTVEILDAGTTGGIVAGAITGPGTGKITLGNLTVPSPSFVSGFCETGDAGGESYVKCLKAGGFAAGFAKTTGISTSLVSSAEHGAVALGYAKGTSTGNATVAATALGTFAAGIASAANTGDAEVLASVTGSFAFGFADSAIIAGAKTRIAAYQAGAFAAGASTNGQIIAASFGCFAQGAILFGTSGKIQASGSGSFAQGLSFIGGEIKSTNSGSFAQGQALGVGGLIEASGIGSFAQGVSQSAGSRVMASGKGAFAQGDASAGDIIASGLGSVQFGTGTNSTPGSLQMGYGIKLLSANPIGTPGDGTIWKHTGTGYVYIRSNGVSVKIV